MVNMEHHAETADDLLPQLVPVSIYHPKVHYLLRPLLTRAVLGADADCIELLVALASPQFETVTVQDGQCSCCRSAGTHCITASSQDIVIRCVQCVLNHKYCDLPTRIRLPTCACEWQIPPEDRIILEKRNRLLMISGKQLGLPKSKRLPTDILQKLAFRINLMNNWFLINAETGYHMDLRLLEPAMQALGVSSLVRRDGKWIVPYSRDWYQCPCYPHAVCSDRHYRFAAESTDTMSDYAARDHGERDLPRSLSPAFRPPSVAQDWEFVKANSSPPQVDPQPTQSDNHTAKGSVSRKRSRKGRA